ncbi:phage major capsid protein [Hymenobacter setariae]|uniref:Phage major capsid protein n=1 Tax=Hymenobacter setariae TaxID=2594794 RepID=A0A558C376_9BACT|nr:phage major capsid protein [Hymenobacter setariae]TVT43112.1 phage major capsid protein [Hymenobacter setariae]
MNELQRLREKRAKKVEEAQAIFNKAKGESRSLNAEEVPVYDRLMAEVRSLATDIQRAEEQEELARETAGNTQPINNHNTQEARDLSKYSLLKVVRSMSGGAPLEGIEREMHQQAVAEARALGQDVNGVGIPQMLLSRRDNSITQPTQPEDGSAVKAVDTVRPIIDLARPKSVLRALGATFLTGLVGDVGVPSLSQGAKSTFKGEIETLDKSNQKFKDAKLTPHRMGTWVRRSKQFLAQTSPGVEALLRGDLEKSVVQELERVAINGDGQDNEPLGILNYNDILQLVLGANGAAPDRDTLVLLEALVEGQNLALDSSGYLINVATKAKLKRTKVDAGSGLFLMNSNTELNGYPVQVTTNVPRDLSKGTSASKLSAAIFGDWSQLLIGQWGGLDITVDNITLAKQGQVEIIIQTFHDVLAAQPKAFAAVKDLLTE